MIAIWPQDYWPGVIRETSTSILSLLSTSSSYTLLPAHPSSLRSSTLLLLFHSPFRELYIFHRRYIGTRRNYIDLNCKIVSTLETGNTADWNTLPLPKVVLSATLHRNTNKQLESEIHTYLMTNSNNLNLTDYYIKSFKYQLSTTAPEISPKIRNPYSKVYTN